MGEEAVQEVGSGLQAPQNRDWGSPARLARLCGARLTTLRRQGGGVRTRLRAAGVFGVPILTQAVAVIASCLAAERELGRIAVDADIDILAPR